MTPEKAPRGPQKNQPGAASNPRDTQEVPERQIRTTIKSPRASPALQKAAGEQRRKQPAAPETPRSPRNAQKTTKRPAMTATKWHGTSRRAHFVEFKHFTAMLLYATKWHGTGTGAHFVKSSFKSAFHEVARD